MGDTGFFQLVDGAGKDGERRGLREIEAAGLIVGAIPYGNGDKASGLGLVEVAGPLENAGGAKGGTAISVLLRLRSLILGVSG